MTYNNDIFSLMPDRNRTIQLIGKLPNNKDIYFRAKQAELIEQYAAARIFLDETENNDWKHWFEPVDNPIAQNAFILKYRAYFYETALFYYNAVVDLSWTLCYVAVEFACTQNGNRVDLNGIKPIEEAAKLLRNVENNVTSPTAEENPFDYLKNMDHRFDHVIDMIIDFWKEFGSSEIRKKYNYCKHKGKPAYSELRDISPGRIMGYYVMDKTTGEKTQMASDASDVQYSFSLEESIHSLENFDNDVLFPYIEKLNHSLEAILQPSPMI